MTITVSVYSATAVFLSTIVFCSVLGESNYQNPVVDIHYDSNGQTVSPEPIAYNSPEVGFSMPPSSDSDTDGYERLRTFGTSGSSNSFVQKRLFNTSVALTVPLFSFTLPQKASQGDTVDLANQAIFGLFSLLVIVLVFAVPIIFTGTRPTERSNDGGALDTLMNSEHVLNFMGIDMKNKIGIDTTKCLQKTICEAHRHPKKYGMLATPFQMFFPPPSDNLPQSKATFFQLAAKDGKLSKKECGKSYNCFFDLLDLAMYLIDWWQYKHSPEYV